MNKNNIFITIKKELRSIFRDKKTIGMILGFPFVIAIFIFLFGFMEDSMMGAGDKKYNIGFNYQVNEVENKLMEKYNIVPKYYNDDEIMNAYEDGIIEAYVLYEVDKLNYVIYSTSDVNGLNVSGLISNYLDDYNQYLGNMKLIDQNISPEEVFDNFTFEMKSLEGEELTANSFMLDLVMNMAFVYIIMAITLAAVNMATSAIAVEKEHGTLETILTLPITTSELIIGKYLATVVIGIFASVIGFFITIISFFIASNIFEVFEKFSISFGAVIWGILICIVASLLIGGLAIALTSSAKTYKEAQASGQILSLLCVVPLFFSYLSVDLGSLCYYIPILNYTTILLELYSGNFESLNLFITVGSTVVYVVVILWFMLKKFKSEKVLFGS